MNAALQYFLILSFAAFAVTGLALGYLASYLLLRTVAYLSPWLPIWMWYGDIGLFIHAVALSATSTVGVIAVLAKKTHALKLCSYILVSLLLIEILVTVQLATRRNSLDYALNSDLEESMEFSQKFYSLNISDTQMWDEIQLEVNCCGVNSYKDWFSSKFGNGSSVPDSCCLIVVSNCGTDMASKSDPGDDIILQGCLPTLMNSIRDDFNHYGYKLWLPVMGMQTVLVMLIIYLVRKVSRDKSYFPYVLSSSLLLSDESPKYEQLKEPYM